MRIFLLVVLLGSVIGALPGTAQNTTQPLDTQSAVANLRGGEGLPFLKQTNLSRSDACLANKDCETCNTVRWCHWCDHDNSCRSVNSLHGCIIGSSCKKKQPQNDTDTCFAHKTCGECALSSRVCHWCAHDNACHVMGSFYGCTTGVDCYDISHCKRERPEKIPVQDLTPQGILPRLVVAVLATLMLCCSTSCCCLMHCVKGTYEDVMQDVASEVDPLTTDQTSSEVVALQLEQVEENIDEPEATTLAADESPTAEAPREPTEEAHAEETQPLLPESNESQMGDEYILMTDSHETTTAVRPPRRCGSRIQRAYHVCICFYVVSIVVIVAFSFAAVEYFPRRPEFNVCNDSVAWKSVVEAMARAKVGAEFQLLASVSNPNRLDVSLVKGSGMFFHKDEYVGSFVLPPTTIEGMSITDILIVASFGPDRWDTLSIGEEFYAGTLVLKIDLVLTVRIPLLADFTYTVRVDDFQAHVNAMADRHLCNCPTWDDAKNKTPPHWTIPPF